MKVTSNELSVFGDIIGDEIENILDNEDEGDYSLSDRLAACYCIYDEIEEEELAIDRKSNSELIFHPYEISYLPIILGNAIDVYTEILLDRKDFPEEVEEIKYITSVLKKINNKVKKEVKKHSKIIKEFQTIYNIDERVEILGNLWW